MGRTGRGIQGQTSPEREGSMSKGWIGVDLDGTLASYNSYATDSIGPPIPLMVRRVRKWLDAGQTVKIFTARIADGDAKTRESIEKWCILNLGKKLEITCCKDTDMIELWDDRAIQVVPNTGQRVDRGIE
jgi:hypothetical protein